MSHPYQFDTAGEATIYPRGQQVPIGPRPAQFGASDPVRALSARIDALLATIPKSVASKAGAPAPAQSDDDEIDGAKIFAARQQAIETARNNATRPAPETETDPFSPGAADAIFQARGQKS